MWKNFQFINANNSWAVQMIENLEKISCRKWNVPKNKSYNTDSCVRQLQKFLNFLSIQLQSWFQLLKEQRCQKIIGNLFGEVLNFLLKYIMNFLKYLSQR